jgi:HNH endonuclease
MTRSPDEDFYESREWLELRYRVLQKSNGHCSLCGCRGTPSNPLQVDHVKPRSKFPHLALAESNLQVLCKSCNRGKSNKDDTNWSFKPSRELEAVMKRKTGVLETATPAQKGKLEQLSWLRNNDAEPQIRKEAEKQYQALWKEIEAEWIARGKPE